MGDYLIEFRRHTQRHNDSTMKCESDPVAMIVCHLQFEIVQYFIVKWDN